MVARVLLGVLASLPMFAHAAEVAPPKVPIGLDAYRQWASWPLQRIGVRAYMRSTYDRLGHNHHADASHFLYQEDDRFNVTLDVANGGILYFARYNHWHGSPWHYEVDGVDHLVMETSSANPLRPVEGSVFLPADLFPNPLTWTWGTTKGADLMWVPVGFEKSFRMAYTRTCYGTGYYIYHQFVPGTELSRPLKAWDGRTPPDQDVLALINRSGTDIAPRTGQIHIRERDGKLDLPGKSEANVFRNEGPGSIRAIHFSMPKDRSLDLANVRLRMTWDARDPSVDAPLPLFFGTGTFYNRADQEYLVKSFPMTVRFDATRIHLACYFPMPFFESATIDLVNRGDVAIKDIAFAVRTEIPHYRPNQLGYFHATYKDHTATPERGKDLVLLDTRNVEGSEHWSGSFVGTTYTFTKTANLTTLEGDPRFFFDDSLTPQAQGTGSEEWGGGGDYWGGRTMTLPFAGHPVGAVKASEAKHDLDKLHSAYRFLLADLMPFGRNARIQLEHGGTNESKEHYETVTYWYGIPAPSLVATDELKIADVESEKAHRYLSPDASEPVEVTSRYELGVDTLGGVEIYPPHTDRGRTTTGTSEFTLKVDPANWGVMLRRKLDYSLPNQRAEVFVADASRENARFEPAGIWYTAGSNTCVFSRPAKELDPTQHVVRTSNRRFRDEEFLLPLELTKGRSAIRIRVKFTPVNRPLFPAHPVPPLAWSEIKYTAYSYVLPAFDP
jgi:hypothetical protein